MKIIQFVCFLSAVVQICATKQHPDVIFALNAGGEEVIGSNNIVYMADNQLTYILPSTSYSAVVPVPIGRALLADMPLYQTERYASENFGYIFPSQGPGHYVLVLKWAEVYFREAGQKIFSVRFNGVTIIKNLDIFAMAGAGNAYDEFIPFSINGSELTVANEVSYLGQQTKLELIKGEVDNPKICAFLIIKGNLAHAHKVCQTTSLPDASKHKSVYDTNVKLEEATYIPQPIEEDEVLLSAVHYREEPQRHPLVVIFFNVITLLVVCIAQRWVL